MIVRALLAWLLILILAILNGALRQGLLIPRFGDRAGHVVSTLLLCLLILAASWLLVPWIRPGSTRDAWLLGGSLGQVALLVAYAALMLAVCLLAVEPTVALRAD